MTHCSLDWQACIIFFLVFMQCSVEGIKLLATIYSISSKYLVPSLIHLLQVPICLGSFCIPKQCTYRLVHKCSITVLECTWVLGKRPPLQTSSNQFLLSYYVHQVVTSGLLILCFPWKIKPLIPEENTVAVLVLWLHVENYTQTIVCV